MPGPEATEARSDPGEAAGAGDGPEARGPSVPGWLPWFLYAVVTLVLFREFVVSDRMLLGTDTLSLGYVARAFYARALEAGVFPLWNPQILGGTPFLESLAGGDSLYPPSVLLLFLTETYRALGWKLLLHVFLAGPLAYGWIRSLDGSRAAALLAGLAYMTAPFLVSQVYPGHDGKLFVTALTPLLFWTTEEGFRGRTLRPWLGVAGVIALVILTTHFQMAYFLFGAVGLYAIFRAVQIGRGRGPLPRETGETSGGKGGGSGEAGREPTPPEVASRAAGPAPAARKFGLFLAAALVGGSLSAVQLVPAVDYVTDASRRTATTVQADEAGSVAYSSSWSLHPEEVAALVVPEFVGNDAGGAEWASDTYWGRNPFKLNHEYGGFVVLLLAGLAFLGARRRGLRWFLTGLGVLGLLYALGTHTPVWRLFYEFVPGVSLFRAPSMAAFLFGFGAVTLAAFGVDRGLAIAEDGSAEEWDSMWRYLWVATALFAVLTVLAASGLLTSAWTSVVYRDLPMQKADALSAAEPFITRGCFLTAVLAALTAGIWWARRRGLLGAGAVVVGLGVLLFGDVFRVDEAFVQTFDFHRWAAPSENVRFLERRQEAEPPFRVLSMVQGGQDVKPAMYGLELAAGHHPNDLARYRELVGMEGSGPPENLLRSPNLLRILNVGYLLWPDAQYGELGGMQRLSAVRGPDGQVVRSVYAAPGLPRARLVGEARVVPGRAAVDTLLGDSFAPEREVVLPEEPPIELADGEVTGEVEWEARTPNRLTLRVRNGQPALLVVSENWYPAWKARVDGEEAPVLRANHTLRAIPLEPGDHRVEMFYESALLRWSLWASVATALLLAAAAGWSFFVRARRATE